MDGHSEGREELLQGEDGAACRVMGAAPQHLEYSSEGGWSLEFKGEETPRVKWETGPRPVLVPWCLISVASSVTTGR